MFYEGKSPLPDGDEEMIDQEIKLEVPPVTEETPQFRNIFINDVVCRGAGQAVFLQGLPEMNLENFVLDGVTMEADKGISCVDAHNITLRNINLKVAHGPALNFYNSKEVEINNFKEVSDKPGDFAVVNGSLSSDLKFVNTNLNQEPDQIKISPSLEEKEVYEIL